MNNINLQNYSHYKLPITMNPLDFGKLIHQDNNFYILQNENTRNIFKIKVDEKNNNYIEVYRAGNLVLSFTDVKKDTNIFVRYILNNKFTFKDNILLSKEFKINAEYIMIYNNNSLMEYQDSNAIQLLKNYDKINPFIFLLILFMMWDFLQPTNTIDIVLSFVGLRTGNIIKLRKRESIHSWNTLEFPIENLLFTTDIFKLKFNLFWEKISHEFTNNNHMFILFKIKYQGSDYTTIGNLQRINKNDKNWYLNWIIHNMIYKSEYYNESAIVSFIFSYGFKNEKLPEKEKISSNVNIQKYKNNNLVISYNPLDYGKLVSEFKWENYREFILQTNDNLLVKIKNFEKYNELDLISGGNTVLKFKDEFISEDKFVRILDNKKYYFQNNKEILFTKEMKTKFITKLSPIKNFKNNFITLDIETFIKDSILTVYCISIFDGKIKSSFFLTDYLNSEELIITALKSIMVRKYNGYNIYIHNLANFDVIFLLKYLVKLGSVYPTIHNGKIININFNYGDYQIQFRDSYLILLNSLRKLCSSFKVENAKSIFPHFFVNENNILEDYKGKLPDLKYFDKITKTEYNEYKSTFIGKKWNLKEEAIKYCELDCISLYQVLFKFSDMIMNYFGRNIHHYPTLPSLAFAIFRSNFLQKNTIPQLSGKIATDIRSGYTGGSCDVFIPKSKSGKKIKCFDVNSLYPYIMKTQLMPMGNPTFFYGDILKVDPNAFGFFYCNIVAPDNIKHPILQTHVKTPKGIRTISPIGNWEDMLFSSEMNNALKYGYKIEILWGYTFEQDYIFKDYVDLLYNWRSQYPKSHPMNYIAKILLNSLYGRFGMDDNFTEVNIIHKDYYPDFEIKFIDNILNCLDLGEYKLVTYKATEEQVQVDEKSTHNVSIGIAAAVTAYARVYMSQFKNNPNINLYYTDTDSVYTDSDIEESLISNTILGKLKLENTCKKAIFLAPKLYCLKSEDNKFIYKVKGLKHEVELTNHDFENLLFKQSVLQKLQTKWIKNLSQGNIEIRNELYTLQVTNNKRKLVFENNKLIETTPYIINENKEILNFIIISILFYNF